MKGKCLIWSLSSRLTPSHRNCWIDVRDLANALVLSTQKEAAGGQRIIVSAGAFKWQDWGTSSRRCNSIGVLRSMFLQSS